MSFYRNRLSQIEMPGFCAWDAMEFRHTPSRQQEVNWCAYRPINLVCNKTVSQTHQYISQKTLVPYMTTVEQSFVKLQFLSVKAWIQKDNDFNVRSIEKADQGKGEETINREYSEFSKSPQKSRRFSWFPAQPSSKCLLLNCISSIFIEDQLLCTYSWGKAISTLHKL